MRRNDEHVREDFPQLVKCISTYWPPVVQDEHCQVPDANEPIAAPNARGRTSQLLTSRPPHAANAEDIGVPTNFNAIVGNSFNRFVQLRFAPKGSEEQAQRETKGSLDDTPTVHSAEEKSRGIWRFEGIRSSRSARRLIT